VKFDKAERATIVVAGTHAQFRHWCREHDKNPTRAIFCEPTMRYVRRLRGLDRDYTDLVLAGTYYENREWPDVRDELRALGLLRY